MDHHEDDDRWDYDCPQFVDFTVPMPFNDGADQMFESTVMGEGPSTSSLRFLGQRQSEELVVPESGKEETADTVSENNPAPEEEKGSKESVKEPAKSPQKGKHPSSEKIAEASNIKKPRKSAERAMTDMRAAAPPKNALTRSKSVRIPKSSSSSSLNSSNKSDASADTARSRAMRGGFSRTQRSGSLSRSNSMDLGIAKQESKPQKPSGSKDTKMPSLMKTLGEGMSASTSKLKSSEELEMDRIKQLQKELQRKRQMAQMSYKKSMTKGAPMAVLSSKGPTLPQEFHFSTDSRLKAAGTHDDEKGPGDFVKSLRSRTVQSPTTGPKKLTIPQPFHLTEKQTRSSSAEHKGDTKFKSMAEQVTAFHKRTPDRFRARARSRDNKRRAGSSSPTRLTQPHTPNLTARTRHRPTHHPTHQELEDKEVEEMKRNQFRAKPVNTKVLSSSNLGIQKVASKPCTKPEEFALSTGTGKKREVEEEHFEFHANPLNKKIFEGTLGVKPAKPAMPTVPMSPAFALKNRVRLPVEIPEKKADESVVRARRVPYNGVPFQPKLPHQHTVPQPFSVEERSKTMLAQREEKIKAVFEEERRAREFHAQPLPSQEAQVVVPHGKDPTEPQPFNLETDQRGSRYQQDLAHKVSGIKLTEEEEEQRQAAAFRAAPNRTRNKEPFIPARSIKPLTEITDFDLNTDRRAVQREGFEMRKKEREVELEGHRRQREQRQREEEEAAVAKLRQEMVHKPNPVRKYQPVNVHPSDKPLTDAESPRFSDRLRTKVRL